MTVGDTDILLEGWPLESPLEEDDRDYLWNVVGDRTNVKVFYRPQWPIQLVEIHSSRSRSRSQQQCNIARNTLLFRGASKQKSHTANSSLKK